MNFNYEVRLPRERIAVLVGVKGRVKKEIEQRLGIKLKVNSKTGDIILEGEDSLCLLTGQNIVRAIGRGFNPLVAFELLDEDVVFESLDMTDYAGNNEKSLIRVRARVIGTEGKARKYVEQLAGCRVVIYGKTIGIIGHYENASLARKAFEGLLSGQRHATIYAWLEKQRKNMKYRMY